MISMKVLNMDKLRVKLRRLGKEDAIAAAKEATQEAAQPAAEAIRSNARSMVGGSMGAKIADAVYVKTARRAKGYTIITAATIRNIKSLRHTTKSGMRTRSRGSEFKESAGDYYIPSAIEYGHAAPYSRTNVKVAAPIPFTRRAYAAIGQRCIRVGRDVVTREIEKRARRG